MHVIIDGYNLLALRGALAQAGEAGREALLRDLMTYRQMKGHPITVVFDGWRQGLGAERHEHRAGVAVIYSKRGEKADQVIQRLAAEYGADCAVVSSDQEVARFAQCHSAFTISAAEFLLRLWAAGRPAGGNTHQPDKEEEPPRRQEKKGNPRKLPKAQRRRRRFLKGL